MTEMNSIFNSFMEIETPRLKLRKIYREDAPSLFKIFSMDEVTKFYDVDPFKSEEEAERLIEKLHLNFELKKQIRWAIILKEKNEFIGTIGYHEMEPEHFKAEIGYDLHPDHWGKGLMTEAINKVVNFGFDKLGFNRIEAVYHSLNEASKRVLHKNGFQYEGTLRKRFLINGEFTDACISSIIRSD
ncbi:GNAT family N-acetyltransferase [Falsibacillus pallidus]|uniref:Ribosomal-protein-alanine N-acetyltransferase n=1 Tax=Falsibacillus pallidus TaxID=493781 RepID=A0A370G0A0_9BACI|nr:GNAT family N-acetyltransferase [Falsibacillus pallidus]RDI36650.1 ribosomal-protein-alanine N-acetyltransferase [Falsibacillus pallidus]